MKNITANDIKKAFFAAGLNCHLVTIDDNIYGKDTDEPKQEKKIIPIKLRLVSDDPGSDLCEK